MARCVFFLLVVCVATACGRSPSTGAAPSTACEAGDAAACVQLARQQLSGAAGGVDKARAIALYEKACASRDGAGCRQAASLQPETRRAEELLQTGCDNGDGHSCAELVAILRSAARETGRADALFARAVQLHEKSCAAGDADGCMGLGRMYGSFAPPDEAKAAEFQKKATALFEQACARGEGAGCYKLGMAHHDGTGAESDFERYRSMMARACELGHLEGCAEAASAYKASEPTGDDAQAPALFEKVCLAGIVHREPCREAGFLYADGEHVPADKPKAVRLLEMSCAMGEISSCLKAAAIYREGDGVPVDDAKAETLAKSLVGLDIKVVSVKRTKQADDPNAFTVGVDPSEMPPVKADKGKDLIVVAFDVRRTTQGALMPIRGVWILDENGERHPSVLKTDFPFGQLPEYQREMVFVVPAGARPVKVKFELGAVTLDLPPAQKG
jgi:TPR repeat protein